MSGLAASDHGAVEHPSEVTPALVVDLLSAMSTMAPSELSQSDAEWALGAVAWLRGWADEQELVAVRRARAKGWGWSEIAGCLGRTRQAVWSMYRALDL